MEIRDRISRKRPLDRQTGQPDVLLQDLTHIFFRVPKSFTSALHSVTSRSGLDR